MKVLYADASECDYTTMKRLWLLADHIGFMDKPAISYGLWATGGHKSPVPEIKAADLPVHVSVHAPPSGDVDDYYAAFIAADLSNPAFVRTVLDGLKRDGTFATMFVNPNANYGAAIDAGDYNGADIISALVADEGLLHASLSDPPKVGFEYMYGISTHEQRISALKYILIEASTKVSSAWAVSDETGLTAISSNVALTRLLNIRASCTGYTGVAPLNAPMLGLVLAQGVLPNEAIERLELDDILEFRLKASDVYKAWATEVNRLAVRLEDLPPDRIEREARKLLSLEVAPKLEEYRSELKSIRDLLIGDLIKSVIKWELPTISVAFVAPISVPSALAAVAAALAPSVPGVVDYFQKRRQLNRKNAMAYLLGLSALHRKSA